MPLRNRVTPLGELVSHPARGLVYGNRGCLHDARGEIRRGWATRRWIACRLEFKGWQRGPLLQPGKFTELFFLDEATAFAAGHRPCALCRREDYSRFAELVGIRGAEALDGRLHGERLDGRGRRLHAARFATLPDGAFVVHDDAPHLVLRGGLRPWSPAGYSPGELVRAPRTVRLLTPPTLTEILRAGWNGAVPFLHASAGAGNADGTTSACSP
jgi:hypothetical protein